MNWIGGCVGPRAGLDDVKKRTIFLYRDSNSDPTVFQPITNRYNDWAINFNDKWS
jgi:hypothetical protein